VIGVRRSFNSEKGKRKKGAGRKRSKAYQLRRGWDEVARGHERQGELGERKKNHPKVPPTTSGLKGGGGCSKKQKNALKKRRKASLKLERGTVKVLKEKTTNHGKIKGGRRKSVWVV